MMMDMDSITAGLDDEFRAFILDACCNNPMARQVATAGTGRAIEASAGLAAPTSLGSGSTLGAGTLIAFTTAQRGARRRRRQQPVLCRALAPHRHTRAQGAAMLTRVRAEVVATTKDQQVPWANSSLLGAVFFWRRSEGRADDNWPNWREEESVSVRDRRSLEMRLRSHAGISPVTVLRIPYFLLFGCCCLGLIASAAFMVTSLYAWSIGWALPTTAIIRWSPAAAWAAHNEIYLGYLLLTLAGLGTLTNCLAAAIPDGQRHLERDEAWLRNVLRWCGFPIIACTLVFSISAMWAGLLRPGDHHAVNIGGLIPFSDATFQLAAAYDQLRDGVWSSFAQRRLFAAAFRSVLLVLSNQSLPVMEALQACLLAGAACFAAGRLASWRGIWSAVAFLALAYIYARIFAPTMLTEPLALIWALLSVGFFVEAFRTRSTQPALIAFALTLVALMTRMGSMFTIPALLVWLIWQFGRDVAAKARIGIVAACILLGVAGTDALLHKTYGTQGGMTGSNFAYVLCGLSIGTTWVGCVARLEAEGKPLQGDEATVATRLYRTAWENIRARPGIFASRLAEGVQTFATEFPRVMRNGYNVRLPTPNWFFPGLLLTISVLGAFVFFVRQPNPVEISFWVLFWPNLLLSASVVYLDDGDRVLAASQPLIALFLASGFGNLSVTSGPQSPQPALKRYAAAAFVAASALLVSIPWLAYRLNFAGSTAGERLQVKEGEAFVSGGRRMSGFLVIDDKSPLPDNIPSLHLADFKAIVERSNIESYQDLLHPNVPPLPFGIVYAPRLEKDYASSLIYIVPAEVLERRAVPAWQFKMSQWGTKPGGSDYWFYVTNAQPWEPSGSKPARP